MLGLILIALGLGTQNLAASAAIGLGTPNSSARWRVGIVFGIFEGGMPVLGATVGRHLASHLGSSAHVIGGVVLTAIGLYVIWSSRKTGDDAARSPSQFGTVQLFTSGFALSIDNLVAGLSLGALTVSLPVVALVIGVVSGAMSVAGMEIGRRIGGRFESKAELVGGLVLGVVGVALATGVLK